MNFVKHLQFFYSHKKFINLTQMIKLSFRKINYSHIIVFGFIYLKKLRSMEMDDQFEDPNFDPIAYLNNKFPDEESLVNLDTEIQKLNTQLADVNKQLIDQIHQHAMMNIEISQQIQKAKNLSKQIIKQIGIIKDKATKSQQIVYDMCKDLKSLDIAKKNLTFSIDALKKFIMMVDALEKLRQACENKQYNEVSNLLSAFNELSNHFKKYEQISQIQDLYKQKNAIIEQLHSQIMEDFQAYENDTSILKEENMASACKVLEILGQKYHRKFIQAINRITLKQYEEQYSNVQNAVLENTERRYGFIKRKMQEFNTKFEKIIPSSWGIDCLLIYQFCSITRLHLTDILSRTYNHCNVAVLMKALQLSLKFQHKITELMSNKYKISIKQGSKKKIQLQALPKFIGSISNSFEPYLQPYIKSQQDALMEGLNKSLQEDKLTQIKVFNSSIVLFHGIKNAIKRSSNYSKGNLLLDMLRVIKKMFRVYSEKVFQKARINSEQFEQNVCWIINTAEYCKNIIDGVKQVLQGTIQQAFVQNVNFTDEEQIFSNLISKSIELFITTLQQKIENLFNNISRTQWQRVEEVVDISAYVLETKNLLTLNFMKIKDQLDSLYLTLYVDKIIVLVGNKFIQNVYKCRKIPSIACQQLHMDIIQLKSTLINMIKPDQRTYNNQKLKQKHLAFVNKTFTKGQKIIKLIGFQNSQFAERYQLLMEEGGIQQLQKILQVRGNKKTDFTKLVNSIEAKSL